MAGARVAIVLAGGASRRFGSDKLVADIGGATLLDTVLSGLPEAVPVIVVGPERRSTRGVAHIREDPPGGGPAAALVAGLRSALDGVADIIWVLPGDTPAAGAAAAELDAALADRAAVVAIDADDRLQPLQLVLTRPAAEQLVDLAGPGGGQHASARRLVEALDPPAARHRVDARSCSDIDTPEQLRSWRTT